MEYCLPTFCFVGLSTDWGFTSNLWQGLWGNVINIYQKPRTFRAFRIPNVRLQTFKQAVKSGGQCSILFGIHYPICVYGAVRNYVMNPIPSGKLAIYSGFNPSKMVIFYSYVKLPEGIYYGPAISMRDHDPRIGPRCLILDLKTNMTRKQ